MSEFILKYYKLPLSEPYRWAKGVQYERCGLIVKCELKGGFGFGEIAPPPHEDVSEEKFKVEATKVLTGLDPEDNNFLLSLDQRQPSPRLRCGISSAWLSAKASVAQVPLCTYLANKERRTAKAVPINALITAKELAQVREGVLQALASGIKTIKIKCTGDHAQDLERVKTVRSVSKEIQIRLDPNGAWDKNEVLKILSEFSSFQVEYVEQPLSADANIETLQWLSRESPIKIALDESCKDLPTIQSLLERGAASHLILKPQRLGGPDKVLEAIKLAEHFNVSCTITGSLETAVGTCVGLHCAALLRDPIPATGLGTLRYFKEIHSKDLQIKAGEIPIPNSTGIGITPGLWNYLT